MFSDADIQIHNTFPEEFPEWLMQLVDKAPNAMSRADILRYWLMYSEGGIYADVDTRPLRDVFSILDEEHDAFITRVTAANTYPNAPNAFFIGAREPKTVFWGLMIESLRTMYKHNWRSTHGNMPYHIAELLNIAGHPDVIMVDANNRGASVPGAWIEHDGNYKPQRATTSTVITESEEQKRFTICNSCEHLTGERCAKCGCSGRHRSRIATVHCPIDKW